jgi:flagellar hook-length control protein FliK
MKLSVLSNLTKLLKGTAQSSTLQLSDGASIETPFLDWLSNAEESLTPRPSFRREIEDERVGQKNDSQDFKDPSELSLSFAQIQVPSQSVRLPSKNSRNNEIEREINNESVPSIDHAQRSKRDDDQTILMANRDEVANKESSFKGINAGSGLDKLLFSTEERLQNESWTNNGDLSPNHEKNSRDTLNHPLASLFHLSDGGDKQPSIMSKEVVSKEIESTEVEQPLTSPLEDIQSSSNNALSNGARESEALSLSREEVQQILPVPEEKISDVVEPKNEVNLMESTSSSPDFSGEEEEPVPHDTSPSFHHNVHSSSVTGVPSTQDTTSPRSSSSSDASPQSQAIAKVAGVSERALETRSSLLTPSTTPSPVPGKKEGGVAPQLESKVMERVEKILNAASQTQEGTTLSFRLDPPDLGSVTVDISYARGELFARITAESNEVGAFLRERSAELQTALRKSGISADTIIVSVRGEENTSNSQGFSMNQNRSQDSRHQQLGSQPQLSSAFYSEVQVSSQGLRTARVQNSLDSWIA